MPEEEATFVVKPQEEIEFGGHWASMINAGPLVKLRRGPRDFEACQILS